MRPRRFGMPGEPLSAYLAYMTDAPDTYENPRGDDPWDNDAVRWLLTQPGSELWTFRGLFEALRQQPDWLEKRPDKVADAAALAQCYGVVQREEKFGRREIVRLERTDRDAPCYPTAGQRQGHRGKWPAETAP